MKKQPIDEDVLARYLAGESRASEKKIVEKWKNASEENRHVFEEFRQIWEASAANREMKDDPYDTESDWKSLKNELDNSKIRLVSSRTEKAVAGNYSKPQLYPWIRVAAIVIFCAVIGIFAYESEITLGMSKQKNTLREITTDKGQRANLTLSDGTKVLLNADSKLELPKVFDSDKREVSLQGQAYFIVAKNPERPFIIHAESSQTQVLGTKFSVRAYPSDHKISVAVKEGRVAFHADSSEKNQTVLHNHQLAEYNMENSQLQTATINDMELYLGWIDGYLKFRKMPMRDVARELERCYGISVSFRDDEVKNRLLTARLKSRSIRNVLDVIAMSLKIDYEIKGDRVIFMEP